jgi:hypothetical protein
MRKAIFLVEDIDEQGPVTLLESIYNKLRIHLDKNGPRHLAWLSEIQRLLWRYPSDEITFVKALDFVNRGKVYEDVDVYYFISCYQNLTNFSYNNFLALDPVVTDFLVKNRIPVIIDCSLEVDENYYQVTRKLFESDIFSSLRPEATHSNVYFRDLYKLEYYIVGSTDFPDTWDERYGIDSARKVKVYHGMFPGCFFTHNTYGWDFNTKLKGRRQETIEIIRSRKITEETKVWRALSSEPRFTRGLFQLKVDSMGLTEVGEYSRLIPGAKVFKQYYDKLFTNNYDDLKRTKYVTLESISTLDEIKILDKKVLDNQNLDYYKNSEFMVWVVLETVYIDKSPLLSNTSSMMTEKTMQPIISGHAFTVYGGQRLGSILKSMGFKEYPGLEFPTQPHSLDELEHITQQLQAVKNLTVDQRGELYETWKEIAVHNFNTYLNMNVQRLYLDNLRMMKSKGT